jgi:HAE1 family hydrophobic/amphiphilic exporter-1
MTKSQYQFTLQSPNLKDLYQYAPQLEAKLRPLPGFLDVTTDLLISNPEVTVSVDRDKAAALGLSSKLVEEALYTAYGSRQVSTIFAPNNQYRVIMEIDPAKQMTAESLTKLYVRNTKGTLISLNTVATIERNVGPLTVTHLGQLPSVTVSFNLAPGMPLGDAVTQVNALAKEVLPESISTSFQGTAQAFQSSMAGMGLLLLAAVLTMYIILGILYESFIHPITILSGLPAAGVGALVTLTFFKMELNIFSFVGIIMLIGIVKKNAIMMVDFALEAQREGRMTPREAIYQACLIRFRPIMMTTMAALMGTLPIAIGVGSGSDARRPLGMAVVGGLVLSQVLTLYITPVFYTYMEGINRFLSRNKQRKDHERGMDEEGDATEAEQNVEPVTD